MDKQTKKGIDAQAGAGTSDKIEGNAKEGRGRLKEAAGDLTGNDKLRHEGAKDKIAGKAQKAVGGAKQGAEHLLDKAKEGLRKH